MAGRRERADSDAEQTTSPGDPMPDPNVDDGDGEREPTPNERASQVAVTDAMVAPRQYADGEGFEAGQRAPSTKYIDRDRENVSDDEPDGGGWVLVQKGDVVSPDVARILADKG